MPDLAIRDQQLPDRIEDVAKFLLIAPERATALRAEIRAIKNLHLAQEVYNQKVEEQRRLQELILDASVKVGEFTRNLPKASGVRTDIEPADSAVARLPKSEAIRDLGFSPKQVERFETLAANPDLVEQVKAEARATGTAPTRTKVLDLAQARKKQQETEYRQIDADYDNLLLFSKAVEFADLYLIDENVLVSVRRVDPDFPETISKLDRLIQMLTVIKNKLITIGGNESE